MKPTEFIQNPSDQKTAKALSTEFRASVLGRPLEKWRLEKGWILSRIDG